MRRLSAHALYARALKTLLTYRGDTDACAQEARWLVDEVRARCQRRGRAAWSADAVQELDDMARRVARDEPLSYVIGTRRCY